MPAASPPSKRLLAVRLLATMLVAMGLGLMGFAVWTVVWGDPFTAVGAAQEQREMRQEFAELAAFPSEEQAGSSSAPRAEGIAVAAQNAKRKAKRGQVAARLLIPSIGVDQMVVYGTRPRDLSRGPGIYPETSLPGSGRPVAIAGHRTTYGAPFLDVDKLGRGDVIELRTQYGRIRYRVVKSRVIAPNDWSIIKRGAAGACAAGACEHLVLTACHPKYSAAQRIAVFAVPINPAPAPSGKA